MAALVISDAISTRLFHMIVHGRRVITVGDGDVGDRRGTDSFAFEARQKRSIIVAALSVETLRLLLAVH